MEAQHVAVLGGSELLEQLRLAVQEFLRALLPPPTLRGGTRALLGDGLERHRARALHQHSIVHRAEGTHAEQRRRLHLDEAS